MYIGLDLAGREDRPTGYALLRGKGLPVIARILYHDDEILDAVRYARIVAIDSPIRVSSNLRGYREIDKVLIRMGYRVLPPTWKGMRILVERAERLRVLMEKNGIMVIETHPRSALLSSGCRSLTTLARALTIDLPHHRLSKDEVDAIIAAIVAFCYDNGCARAVQAVDGIIYLLNRICSV